MVTRFRNRTRYCAKMLFFGVSVVNVHTRIKEQRRRSNFVNNLSIILWQVNVYDGAHVYSCMDGKPCADRLLSFMNKSRFAAITSRVHTLRLIQSPLPIRYGHRSPRLPWRQWTSKSRPKTHIELVDPSCRRTQRSNLELGLRVGGHSSEDPEWTLAYASRRRWLIALWISSYVLLFFGTTL